MIQKLNIEVIKRASRTPNPSKPKSKPSSKENHETKLSLREEFFWIFGIFEYLHHWIFFTSFWLLTQVVTQVSAQVATETSTDTPWRPAGHVITPNDAPNEESLEPHAKEQLSNIVRAESKHRIGRSLSHIKHKTKLFVRQKLDWLLGIFVHLYREHFLTLFIIGASGLLFWSGYALLACLVTEIWLWVSFAWFAWTTRKDEILQKDEESSIKKSHGTITHSYPSSPDCTSPSDCTSSPEGPSSLEASSSLEGSSSLEDCSSLEGPSSPDRPSSPDFPPVVCIEEQATNRTIVPATLPVPVDCAQLIIPPEVQAFVYNGYNHSGEPLNQLPNEECGKEPWSIFTLHRNHESQSSGPPVVHEWRETSSGELEHFVQRADLSMSPEGEEYVVTEDNFDKDWTLVAERRKKAQVAAEEDEQRRELFS